MPRHAECPSCAAAVEFKSVVSILAVCEYCQSTLLRQGKNGEVLENLGTMAQLLEDRSPLQRHATGRYEGVNFALIGRLQLRYEAGLWNEWHVLFDDGKSGWLSESGGEYVFSRPQWVQDTLPAFKDLTTGQSHRIAGKMWQVTNILEAECVAGEGELPFKVGAGYPAPVVDLRNDQGEFATLDYSDDPMRPLLFIGRPVKFSDLRWNGLRDHALADAAPTLKARALSCPGCGAPLQVRSQDILSVGCGSCGTILDPSHEIVKTLGQGSFQKKVEPLIPLGTRGLLRGEKVEVIGFMRRRMQAEGINYYWSEYVLLGPDNRLLWLTESTGHWNIARVLPRSLSAGLSVVTYEKEKFKHFQTYPAFVDYVIGEFPWQVKIDEQAEVADYVAPPKMLSRERTPSEVTWTLCEYIEASEIESAFPDCKVLPPAVGVYANQPNPLEARHQQVCRLFWQLFGVGLLIHFVLLFLGPGGRILKQTLELQPQNDEPIVTQEFRLPEGARRLDINHDTDLHNNWIGLNLTLVNKDTGQTWQAARELSRYEGVDEGESWSEGSRGDQFSFADIPPGTYILAEEAEGDPKNPRAITSRLTIERSGPRWSSLFILLLVLSAFPIYTRIRKGGFEVKRWADSDHPIVTSESSDDD